MKKIVFIMPLMAVSLLASCNNGGGGDNPIAKVTHNVKFNIADCSVTYEGNEVGADGIDIKVPQGINPYYVKFSVKASDSVYKKPSDVILDKTTDYTFDEDSGDLYINLQSNLNVTGTCDMYKSLEECTWSQIKTISEKGEAIDAFHIGDEKTVTLLENGVEQKFEHTVRIIGFNHDMLASTYLYAGITFEFTNVITKGLTKPDEPYTTIWDDYSDSNYDYRNSTLNDNLNNETAGVDSVINRLPSDLKCVIEPVRKKVGVSTGQGQPYEAKGFASTNCPKLFPLSYYEMSETYEQFVTDNEGIEYPYYNIYQRIFNSLVKTKVGSSVGQKYWFRSPDTSAEIFAWNMDEYGQEDSSTISSELAIAPAFCI